MRVGKRAQSLQKDRHGIVYRLILLSLALLCAGLSCSLFFPPAADTSTPTGTATLVRRATRTATGTATQTFTPTASPTPTITPTPSNTFTPTRTFTFTPQPTRTDTPSRTPVPPTYTPAPNQITQGFDVWQLNAIKLQPRIRFLDVLITPQQYNRSPGGYVFLVMEFECQTEVSLIALFDLQEYGLTFVHRVDGYPHLWLEDDRQRTFPVNLIGACWLAAPVPPDIKSVTLFYKGQIFQPTLPVVTITE